MMVSSSPQKCKCYLYMWTKVEFEGKWITVCDCGRIRDEPTTEELRILPRGILLPGVVREGNFFIQRDES